MIALLLFAALICDPSLPWRTIVYPTAELRPVPPAFIPGSEPISNSVLRADALAAHATADACLQRMLIPRLSPYGGERNTSASTLCTKDIYFTSSPTNYGLKATRWFQNEYAGEGDNPNYFAPASNRVFKLRFDARLRNLVSDYVLGVPNDSSGRMTFDPVSGFRWIDPTVFHPELVQQGWKLDDMQATADWKRFLRALGEFKPDGVSYGRFCPNHGGNILFSPFSGIGGLRDYMIEGNFPMLEWEDMTGEAPTLLDLVSSRCHVRTNGVSSSSGRLSYDRMAMANGVVSLCETSLHAAYGGVPFYPRDYEGNYAVPSDESYPFYLFTQRQYTLAKSATMVYDISPSAALPIGNIPGSDNPAMWQSVHYFPRDSDLENPRLSSSNETVSVVTNFVDVGRNVNVWSDVNPKYMVHMNASRPLRFNEFSYDASPINDYEPYYLFAHTRPSPSYDENPSKDVIRNLIVELWAGRTSPTVGYPQPEVKIGSLNVANLTNWTGRVTFHYEAQVQGAETLEKRPFIGPTYATTPDDQAAHYWDYSVNPYLPKEEVFELVEKADGYSFQTVAVNTNHALIAYMASTGGFEFGQPLDNKEEDVKKDTWAFFRIKHKDLGKPNGDSLTRYLTQEIYGNIKDDIIDVYGMTPHADLRVPLASEAAKLDASDLREFRIPVLIGGEEQPSSVQYRIRTEPDPQLPEDKLKRILFLETAAGAAVPFDTVIYHVGINSGVSMPQCPGFRSVAVVCSENPCFTLKWKFPSMRFSGEKSK